MAGGAQCPMLRAKGAASGISLEQGGELQLIGLIAAAATVSASGLPGSGVLPNEHPTTIVHPQHRDMDLGREWLSFRLCDWT